MPSISLWSGTIQSQSACTYGEDRKTRAGTDWLPLERSCPVLLARARRRNRKEGNNKYP
jgi:hypothetical protein